MNPTTLLLILKTLAFILRRLATIDKNREGHRGTQEQANIEYELKQNLTPIDDLISKLE
jgi:hypothetical protein